MKIEVLGSGCPRCHTLEKHVREAVKQLGIDAKVEHITDLQHSVKRMQEVRAMSTPVLVVEGKLLSQGKVPAVPEIVQILASYVAEQK